MPSVVSAFVSRETVEQLSEQVPEPFAGTLFGAAYQRPELGEKTCSMGLRSGPYGGR